MFYIELIWKCSVYIVIHWHLPFVKYTLEKSREKQSQFNCYSERLVSIDYRLCQEMIG